MAYVDKVKASGRWIAQVNRNGKRTSKVFDTKREAQSWAMEQEAKATREKDGKGFTFGDAVDKYLLEVSSKKDGKVWEKRRLEAMRGYFGADALLTDIDTPQVASWRDWRLLGDKDNRPVSGSTVVRDANLLRNVFNVARDEWKWMQHSPFAGAKMPVENQPRQTTWGWRDIRKVLRAPRVGKTAEMQKAFHLALRTGMRLAEVLQSPPLYDADKRVVTLKTKTEQVGRVPIGRIAHKMLINQPSFAVDANEGSVLFSKLCRELLIEGLTFHDTRATALTHLAKKVPVEVLAKISRHKDISLLVNVYYRPKASDISKMI